MRRTLSTTLMLLALSSLGIAGCGSGSDDGSGDNGGENGGSMDATSEDGSSGGDTGNGGDGGIVSPDDFKEIDCSKADSPTTVQVGPDFVFKPETATVQVGGVVKWKWADGVTLEHDVVADDDSKCEGTKRSWFESKRSKSPGTTYCVRFEKSGTWNYQCTVSGHCPGGMKGKIEVQSK